MGARSEIVGSARYSPWGSPFQSCVPEALDPLFRAIFAEHWEHLRDLSAALDAHLDELAAERLTKNAAERGSPAEYFNVPRALGSSRITVGGSENLLGGQMDGVGELLGCAISAMQELTSSLKAHTTYIGLATSASE